MSYTRTAIATATIVISLAAAGTGTRPASASPGLAGTMPPNHKAHSHRPSLQAPAAPAQEERIFTTTIHAETDEQRAMAESALAEMAAAGFALPPVTIHLHSDTEGCNQLNGYFVQIDGENIVHSCSNRWILIHELAHVWEVHTLDEETRAQFTSHQGLDSWNHETWNQAAGEHLASIVAWALDGAHPTTIGYYDRAHLAAAYELATGTPVPGKAEAKRRAAAPAVVATTSPGSPQDPR